VNRGLRILIATAVRWWLTEDGNLPRSFRSAGRTTDATPVPTTLRPARGPSRSEARRRHWFVDLHQPGEVRQVPAPPRSGGAAPQRNGARYRWPRTLGDRKAPFDSTTAVSVIEAAEAAGLSVGPAQEDAALCANTRGPGALLSPAR
jgi:hypothetical protein